MEAKEFITQPLKTKEIIDLKTGKVYMVSSRISLTDLQAIHDILSETNDCRKAVASIICEHHNDLSEIDSDCSIENVLQADDSVYIEFIDFILAENEEIAACYNDTDDALPVIQRFCIACEIYSSSLIKNFMSSLNPVFSAISKTDTTYMFEGYRQVNQALVKSINEIMKDYDFSYITDTLKHLTQSVSGIIAQYDFPAIIEGFQAASSAVLEGLKRLHIPGISEGENHRLLSSYRKWGALGWTTIPWASDLFADEPTDINEANTLGIASIVSTDFNSLLSDMADMRINKNDFSEAVFCYRHKQYKACVLILFSLIEAKIIRAQPKPKSEKDPLYVGNRAIKFLEDKYQDRVEAIFKYFLLCENLFSCLATLYRSCPGFIEEPFTINRHFLAHGMTSRRVRKRDCIQLFLALYNLLKFYEVMAT